MNKVENIFLQFSEEGRPRIEHLCQKHYKKVVECIFLSMFFIRNQSSTEIETYEGITQVMQTSYQK